MLNLVHIQQAMGRLGLNQAALAQACGVSREAVSKWFAGESIPRPAKLRTLASALGLDVASLAHPSVPEAVIAYRTHLREPLSERAKATALDMGRHFRQLQPFLSDAGVFVPRVLQAPNCDEPYVRQVVGAIRASLHLAPDQSPTWEQLIDQLQLAGACVAPVFWGRDKVGHENALTIHLPDLQQMWVILSLAASADDFKYWLAHELGHCLSLHRLTDDAGEAFAERFAQLLVFPDTLAASCLAMLRASDQPLEVARQCAAQHGVSVVTALKSADRLATTRGEPPTGVATEDFYGEWARTRMLEATVASKLFGTDRPCVDQYVERSSEIFRTDIFNAIARLQKAEGGHSPAFVSGLLNMDLSQALEISTYLSQRNQP